ncbi:MAG: hypothetical protein NUW24_17180 [Anaerolineae bacterium]|jgi:hypothetical protein|nr:hypothetical protein [Anaerolineae bacterium]MDH7473816.1 hypothetical protein [Anaerolineae bacterium]
MIKEKATGLAGYTVRDWVYVAVFGALWGAAELTLGSYLHVLFPPLADTFIIGLVMASLGAIIVLVGRQFVPRLGAVLMMGIVTALLKTLSLGGVVIGPIVAILAESLLIEATLLLARRPTRWSFILAGILAVSWNFFHKFIMMRLLYGKGIEAVYAQMIADGSKVLHIDVRYGLAILLSLFLVRVIVGALAGWLAWDLGGAVRRRLASEG